jgi:gliding motility-associated-like protein
VLATLSGATTATGLTTLAGVDFNLGTTTVLWTVTDNSGNTNSCAFTVTVADSTAPSVISCALTGNQQVSTSAELCYYLNQGASWNPTATDNCSTVSMNYTLSGATSGTGTSLNNVQFMPGTTNVNWTISDTSGNVSYCAYSITVIDNQDPQISCIANQTVATQSTTCTFLQTSAAWNASASDNCTVSTLSYVLTGATTGTGTSLQNVAFSPGVTTVTWTATDNSGNTNSCVFTVTVVDSTAPSVISCALTGNQQVSTSAGLCYYLHQGASWNPTATDNCSTVSMNYTLSGATSGTGTSLNNVQFMPGTTNVNWTISDTSGNVSYCAYSITVIDTEAPTISGCPQNISVASQSTICGQWVEWNSPLASDNCSVSMTESLASGTYLPVGLHTINYIAIDGNSNSTTCSFTVNVLDTTPPIVACPSTIHSCQSTVSFGLPNISDNCAVQSVLQTQGLPSQSQFPIGQTTNTYLVTDIHGNSSTCSFTVDIHTLPIITLDVNNVSCYDLNDGAIDATVTNAVVPFTYSWTNEQTTEDLEQLAPGNYTLTVSDNYGCQSTASAVITEPDVLVLLGDADSVSCFNSTDGGFDLSVNGGTLPYLFSWSDDSSMEDLSNVGSGTYSVTVSDGNGCTGELTTVILSPEALTIQSSTTNATCTSSTGAISINVNGGTTPYAFEWSNGSTESNLTNVPSGLYTLTITDDNNCSVQNTMLVESSTIILAELSAKPALCAGIADGSIHATVIEGTPPYTYEWSNGASTPSLEALYTGNFSVVITDSYGCKDTVFAELTAPDTFYVLLTPSVYSAGTNISTYGNDDGFILTSIQGGNSSYTYSWSNGSIQSDIYNLTAGNYAVIVTNENGCEVSASITLTQPNALALPSGLSPNGDSDNDFFVVRGIESYPDNDIVIFNRWGNVVYQQNDYSNEWDGVNRNGEELPDGTYFVILRAFGEETITLKGYVDLRR